MSLFKSGQKAVIFFVAAVTLLLVLCLVNFFQFRSFLVNLNWFTHTHTVLQELKTLALKIERTETAQRGFLVTNDPSYFDTYQTNRQEIWPVFQQLQGLTLDNNSQQQRFTLLRPLLQAKIDEMDQTVDLSRRGHALRSLQLVVSDDGQTLMEQIDNAITTMEREERRLLDIRTQQLDSAIALRTTYLFLGTLVSIVFLTWTFFLLTREIRKKTEAETKALDSENRLRILLDNARDYALYMLDSTGRIETWTHAAERLYGYTIDQVIGRSHELLFSPTAVEKGQPARLLVEAASGGRYEERAERARRDGTTFQAEVVVTPVLENGTPRGFTFVTRDVTEKYKAEEALRRSEAQVIQLQKMDAIGRLAGGVAHDFNNLLTGILGYSEELLLELGPDSKLRGDVEEILNAGKRAASLTRQLLAFSRRQIATPLSLNLNTVVTELEKMLRRLVPENIDIRLKLAADLGLVRADPMQLEQILINLIVNARDAMPKGGLVSIETSNIHFDEDSFLDRSGLTAGAYVVMAVSDTGHGMTPEIQSQIFEPFFTTKPQGQGTGLGLSTVYGIVKQNQGHVIVYSAVDKGTTFKIYLPRTLDREQPYKELDLPSQQKGGSERILLVENEDLVRHFASRTLSALGYHVLVANDGSQALEVAKDGLEKIDLLLTDVVMPILNGPELALELCVKKPQLKVLYMSGYTQNIIVHGGILKSGINFLEKPFNASDLARKVRQCIDANQ